MATSTSEPPSRLPPRRLGSPCVPAWNQLLWTPADHHPRSLGRLTEQYTKVLIPSDETRARLQRRAGLLGPSSSTADDDDSGARLSLGRREVLADAHERAAFDKWQQGRQQELEDQAEADRIAFAQVDWQDFAVVSTIEFTEQEEAGGVELPPPMSLAEVENMTLAQKKMAAMIMEGREGEEEQEEEREEPREEDQEMEMDSEDEADKEQKEAELELERQRVVAAGGSNAPMKIRKDYVPKCESISPTRSRVRRTDLALPPTAKRPTAPPGPNMTMFGNQQVPVDELSKHIQIELLDPRYKEQKRVSEANRSAANLLPGGTDVSSSIRALALHRPDIFGEPGAAEEEAKRQQEIEAKARARAKDVWDGHTASKESIQARYQTGADLDEQIEAIHRAHKLVGLVAAACIYLRLTTVC